MSATKLPHHLLDSLPEESSARIVLQMDKTRIEQESRANTPFWIALTSGIIATAITFTNGDLIYLAGLLAITCIAATVVFNKHSQKAREVRKFYKEMSTAVEIDKAAGVTFSPSEIAVFEAMYHNQKDGAIFHARNMATGLLIALLIVFIPMRWGYESDGSESGAIIACENAISQQLKDPHSASFSGTTAAKQGEREWLITGTVRGTNSFGATVPALYVCTAKWNGSDYTTIGSIQRQSY
ncbi:hypothetical protein [Actinomyces sp.]|uniref:hypothetical protein n=1 Tax=Actinomyces sp. TaxID=29317 RepID=UPI0026DD6E6D|nr:hypothetical protein [Actinomyces sp.]MDO4901823.1 hypothetical protein [Actinomyces sp.]